MPALGEAPYHRTSGLSCCGHLWNRSKSAEISHWGAFPLIRRDFQGPPVHLSGLGNDRPAVSRHRSFGRSNCNSDAPWKPKKREIRHSVRNDESQNFSAGCKATVPRDRSAHRRVIGGRCGLFPGLLDLLREWHRAALLTTLPCGWLLHSWRKEEHRARSGERERR